MIWSLKCLELAELIGGKMPNSRGKKPNFLVIMSDEHAPMWSSAYGHPFVKTPNMDRLAHDGNIFDAAYCNAPICVI